MIMVNRQLCCIGGSHDCGILLEHAVIIDLSWLINVNCHIINVSGLTLLVIVTVTKDELLVGRLKHDVASVGPIRREGILSSILLLHVFLDALGKSNGIGATRLLEMGQVWNEVALRRLLFSELVRLHVSVLLQVLVERRLAWQLSAVDFLGPEGVLAQMLPRNPLHRVFLKEATQ